MGEKIGSEKEVQAVMYNIKEQRLLEKALGTLSLEESYSIRLLNLGHKTIKVRQRRLKNKVNKIKSHLAAEDIADLKLNGIDEQLAKRDNVTSNGAVRIAAAAKRLKLGVLPGAYRRTSAFRRPNTAREAVSDDGVGSREEKNVEIATPGQQERSPYRPRPATSAGMVGLGPRTYSAKTEAKFSVRPKTAPGPKPKQRTNDIDDILNDERNNQLNVGKANNRPGSAYSSSSFGEELRKSNAMERRQEMIEQEALYQESTKGRCDQFMEKADRWVRENPAISFQERSDSRAGGTPRPASSLGRGLEQPPPLYGRRDSTPIDPEAAWRDLKKCRYLRMDSEQLDLTGINTLVKDQMHMTKIFRQ